MADALIGHTGFVGGNLKRQHEYTELYNSRNIDDIRGRSFDLVVCAGMPAEKWRANQEPDHDRASLTRLTDALARVQASSFVLISTVDVYPEPLGVDEETLVDVRMAHPYGLHRYELEEFVRARFPVSCVVRLPGLYGTGLKKNILYDFLHHNQLDRIHADAEYQFYGLDRLWGDIHVARQASLPLINLVTEPVSVRQVADEAFGLKFENRPSPSAARYNVTTRYARQFGEDGVYVQSGERVLRQIRNFVNITRTQVHGR